MTTCLVKPAPPRALWLCGAFLLVCGFPLTDIPHLAAGDDLSGHWSGYWISDSSGHRGPLQGTFTRIDDTSYRADFRGRFLKIVPFRYSVQLDVVGEGEAVELAGVHRVGRRGDFHYRAEVTGSEFNATFSSCKDAGRFVMTRCGTVAAPAK